MDGLDAGDSHDIPSEPGRTAASCTAAWRPWRGGARAAGGRRGVVRARHGIGE